MIPTGWHDERIFGTKTPRRRLVSTPITSDNSTDRSCLIQVTELVCPPLAGLILPGVTRDSVLNLARDHASGKTLLEGLPESGKFVVNERPVTMGEVKQAAEDGRLLEFFGTGVLSAHVVRKRLLNVCSLRNGCRDQSCK